jgi:nucleoside-diphosphate-sugar epimerase
MAFSTAWNIGPAREGICSVENVYEKIRTYFNSTEPYSSAQKIEVPESDTLGLDIEDSVGLLGWSPEQPLDKMMYDLTDFFKRQRAGEPEREICARQIREFFEI